MKIESAGAAFTPCGDRFVPGGYKEGLSMREQIEIISGIKGIKGIPVLYPLNEFNDVMDLKNLLDQHNLKVGTVCPDTYTLARWKNGTLASRDPNTRKEMIKIIKESMDFCSVMGGADILLWLAHDGYDYPFEDNYRVRWDYLVEGLKEVAAYRKDIKVTIEYKVKEPRIHQYISDVGKSLLICEEVGLPNLGVVIDFGHSMFGGENPAESVALLDRYKRLFHVHLNDNYRSMDDDLILGSVHFWETLEFFYMLDRVGYDSWYTIDIWPARIDGIKALKEFTKRTVQFMNMAKSLPYSQIKEMQDENRVADLLELLREKTLR